MVPIYYQFLIVTPEMQNKNGMNGRLSLLKCIIIFNKGWVY